MFKQGRKREAKGLAVLYFIIGLIILLIILAVIYFALAKLDYSDKIDPEVTMRPYVEQAQPEPEPEPLESEIEAPEAPADNAAPEDEVDLTEPTEEPTPEPTPEPTEESTLEPTAEPTPEPTPEPEPTDTPAPVMVPVRYVDPDGADVASRGQVWCAMGDTEISAAPVDLPEDYQPDGPQTVLVHVDENGPDPAEIIFTYRLSVEPPAPKVALVNVKYVSPNGETFYSYSATCVEGQENKVEIDWSQVNSALGYELASDAAVFVTVDETGAADPAEVIFKFRDEISAYVTIRYQDAATGRDIASSQQKMCYVGTNTVDAHPLDLEENYALAGESSAIVVLDAEGVLTPAEVVFLYRSVVTATPEPKLPAFDTAMDAYFYPTGSAIRLRSTPTTADNNILTLVSSGDLGHALGKVVNDEGKVWYAVEINGFMGYMSETVVRFLSEAEMAALFNYTLAPTQEPTPLPTEIPDGAVIDRWGTTTNSVNFRKNADRNASKITELKKNTRVWIYSSQTVNGEKWYAVRCNGTDGYVMADYIQMASAEDSADIQAQLASPMPTQTAKAPTREPTPEPTLEPTETPEAATPVPEITEEPTLEPSAAPTETPSPYRGYALTTAQSALRTGVSQTDDTILEMLPPQTLMLVNGETYVDGVAWDSVQVLSSGNLGFILQSSLMQITGEEARPYLDQLQPTPAPTIAPQEQTEGLAMTLGDGVPMRNFPDTNGEIITLLPYMAVAQVRGQQIAGNAAWHLVQYNGMWGYIRQDQLRMMSPEETRAYEESLTAGTPTPSAAPMPTPEPVTNDSLSSYGHVQSASGRVNLRSEPTTKNNNAIRLLDNYAFALVLGSVTNDEGTWYHVSQGGNEGYIRSDYFHVLTLGELSDFLQSSEYLNANSNNTTSGATTSQIQPVEDYNQTVWQNPALSASYEPFNPYATPTPDLERLNAETPAPTPSPTPTPEIAPVSPQGNVIQPDNTVQAGSPWPWVLAGLAVVGLGGAYYAYIVHRQNEKRRQTYRAQQARAARSAAAAQPQMRAAQNNPGQNPARPVYPVQSAPFMPPQGGVPQSAQNAPQNTSIYRATGMSPQQTAGSDTKSYQPLQQTTQTYQPPQPTQYYGYPANQQSAESPAREGLKPMPQDTQSFKPAPMDPNAKRLNLQIKTARLEMEELPTQYMEDDLLSGKKRVRRTERNKALYDGDDPDE